MLLFLIDYVRFRDESKHKGMYGLHLHYFNLLREYPGTYLKRVLQSMRLDVEKIDNLSKETKLLSSNELETCEQFFLYKD